MKRSILRHPAVISGVVLGLAAVVVLNLKTFASGRWLAADGAERIADHLLPPADLDLVVKAALDDDSLRRGFATAGGLGGPSIARDPFTGGGVAAPVVTATPEARRAPRPRPLVCTAVMLGGKEPLALINGESVRPGDHIRGLKVVRIDTDGVVLLRSDGRQSTLSVGPEKDGAPKYHVITESGADQDRGTTRLVKGHAERTK